MSEWLAVADGALGISDPGTLIVSTLVFLMLPGPGTFAVLAAAARRGLAGGFAALAGLMAGDLMLMALASGGVATLLAAHPAAFRTVQYAGVAYLVWIGVQLLRTPSAARGRPASDALEVSPQAPSAPAARQGARSAFGTGLLITLLNPKAIVFYMAFFPLFVDPARHRGVLTFAALAATVSLLTLGYGTLLVVVGNVLARRLSTSRRLAVLARRAAGVAMMAFGVKLAVG